MSTVNIDLGKLTKPMTVLIEKISAAVGTIYEPHHIRRIAQAKGDAEVIHAATQIEIIDLRRRAMERFVHEEAKKQQNIESIATKALPNLDENAQPENIENDWMTNFFDKCRLVSDGDLQNLWGKVLAGEANSPGRYSKRTVNLLGSLEKSDALLFQQLCCFAWHIVDEIVPIVFDYQASIYQDANIHFESLTHLNDLGLIRFAPLGGFKEEGLDKRTTAYYFQTPINIGFIAESENDLPLGHVLLSKSGREIESICGSCAVPSFFEYTLTRLVEYGLVISSPYPQFALQ